jgi:hypothetical protein
VPTQKDFSRLMNDFDYRWMRGKSCRNMNPGLRYQAGRRDDITSDGVVSAPKNGTLFSDGAYS